MKKFAFLMIFVFLAISIFAQNTIETAFEIEAGFAKVVVRRLDRDISQVDSLLRADLAEKDLVYRPAEEVTYTDNICIKEFLSYLPGPGYYVIGTFEKDTKILVFLGYWDMPDEIFTKGVTVYVNLYTADK
jgi:hypothetical protein